MLRTPLRTARLRRRVSASYPAAEGEVRIAPRRPQAAVRSGRGNSTRVFLALLGSALLVGGLAVALSSAPPAGGPSVVLVAARSLPAGTPLRPADLQRSSVGVGRALLATLVPAGDEPLVLGTTLAEPLEQGSRSSAPRSPPARTRPRSTLTVGAEHALGGALRAGDRISVLATFQSSSGTVATRLLARNLIVLAVGKPPSLGDPSQATIPVTVALPVPAVASRLALANAVGHIDLLRDGAPRAPGRLHRPACVRRPRDRPGARRARPRPARGAGDRGRALRRAGAARARKRRRRRRAARARRLRPPRPRTALGRASRPRCGHAGRAARARAAPCRTCARRARRGGARGARAGRARARARGAREPALPGRGGAGAGDARAPNRSHRLGAARARAATCTPAV